MQASEDIESNIMQIKQNEPYIVVAEVDMNKQQFFVVVERSITIESDTFQDALTDMIGLYFTLEHNLSFQLVPSVTECQRYQTVPPVVTRLLSLVGQHQLSEFETFN